MNSMTPRALSVALLVAGAAGAAGCSSSSSGSAEDAGPSTDASSHDSGHVDAGHVDSGKDSGHPDAAHKDTGPAEASADAGEPDCGAVAPTGTQLVKSTDPLILQGGRITSDGNAFYLDANTQDLFTIPAAGGTPTKLGTMTSQSNTFWANGGKAALFLTAPCNPETLLAPLWAWTAAAGAKEISATAFSWDSFNYTYDATQDGTSVTYFVTPGDGTAALTVTSLAVGATPQTLVTGISLATQDCWPFTQFVGDTVVAHYCLASGKVTIASFAGPTYAQTTLATFPAPTDNAPLEAPAAVSPDHNYLLVTSEQGASNVSLYPIAGGAPTTLSATGEQAVFAANGDIIVIRSDSTVQRFAAPKAAADAGSVDASATDASSADATATDAAGSDAAIGDAGGIDAASVDAGGGPITLLPGSAGVEGLLSLSGDGNWLQLLTNYTDTYPYPTNIGIASASTPGAVTIVWSPLTASALGFTADSKYEVFAAPAGDAGLYELGASAVAGGSLITIPDIAAAPTYTTASKFILSVNTNTLTGGADLESVDLTNPGSPSTLVTQADPYFFYTGATSKQLLYSWHCEATHASGVWALSNPQ